MDISGVTLKAQAEVSFLPNGRIVIVLPKKAEGEMANRLRRTFKDVHDAYPSTTGNEVIVVQEGPDKLERAHDRLLVLATKWCPRDHHDWGEVTRIAHDRFGVTKKQEAPS